MKKRERAVRVLRVWAVCGGVCLAMAACTGGKEESAQSGGVGSGEKGEKGSRKSGRPGGAEAKVAKARSFAKLLFDKKYADAVGMFNGTMAKAMPVEKLKATWESIVRSMGAPKTDPKGREGGKGEGEPTVAKKGDLTAVSLPLDLEKGALVMRVVVDKDGKVAGLFFRPGNKKVSYTPPAYVDTSKFKEVEVTVGEGKWKLPGTLTVPKGEGEVCGVVLVHGSGPHDRDETIPPNKPFRDLAWGLASKGVAVLRYEKRTKAHGAQMVKEKVKVTLKEEVVDDAVAAAKLLRAKTKIQPDCVFVAGHSLGANVSPLIGSRDPRLGGLILLAGNVTSLEKLALEQYKYFFNLDGKVSAQEKAALDKLVKEIEILKDPEKLATAKAKFLPLGLDRTYWKSVLAYDPVKVARKLKVPMLVLQGGRDYQVTPKELELWKKGLKGKKNVTFKSYPKLNHLMMAGEGKSTPDEYKKPGHVAAQVLEDMVAFIKEHAPKTVKFP